MAKLYNYYGVKGDYAWRLATTVKAHRYVFPKLFTESDLVWQEGPRGGIKLIWKHNCWPQTNYITNDYEAMKEFAWAKLRAQTLNLSK